MRGVTSAVGWGVALADLISIRAENVRCLLPIHRDRTLPGWLLKRGILKDPHPVAPFTLDPNVCLHRLAPSCHEPRLQGSPCWWRTRTAPPRRCASLPARPLPPPPPPPLLRPPATVPRAEACCSPRQTQAAVLLLLLLLLLARVSGRLPWTGWRLRWAVAAAARVRGRRRASRGRAAGLGEGTGKVTAATAVVEPRGGRQGLTREKDSSASGRCRRRPPISAAGPVAAGGDTVGISAAAVAGWVRGA